MTLKRMRRLHVVSVPPGEKPLEARGGAAEED
jgi:hypothetical protein